MIVHKEFEQNGVIQPKGKCSVSITYSKNNVAIGHTAINVIAGEKAPSFAYSTNLTDNQVDEFMKLVVDTYYSMVDDAFIATTKLTL